MFKTQRNKKHRTIQNHAIRETVHLVKRKVSFFFGGNKLLFFPWLEYIWQSRNIELIIF